MWLGAQVSGLLGNQLPGPGTVHSGQDLEFLAPVPIGEQVTISITATAKDAASRRVTFDCRGVNARGETIMTGTARVIAPQVKITMERPDAAQVSIQSHDNLERFVERCQQLPPVSVAVAHPCDESSLGAALRRGARG
jgi:phosphate acetyltransferase